jgi:hypothetical protein
VWSPVAGLLKRDFRLCAMSLSPVEHLITGIAG